MKITTSVLSKLLLSYFSFVPFRKGLRFIFVFHDISSTDSTQHYPVYSTELASFETQIKYLLKHFRIIPLTELVHSDHIENNSASIVFDDGFKSVLTNAFPVLRSENIPFTIFINKNAVMHNWLWCSNLFMAHKNSDHRYLKRIYDHFSFETIPYEYFCRNPAEILISEKRLSNDYDIFFEEKYSSPQIYLDSNDLFLLLNEGCALGSHTANHKLLSCCNDETLENEIVTNAAFIQSLTGNQTKHFAIPFGFEGTFDERALKLAEKYHSYIYTTDRKYFNNNDDSVLPRIGLRNEELKELMYAINLPLAVDLKNKVFRR